MKAPGGDKMYNPIRLRGDRVRALLEQKGWRLVDLHAQVRRRRPSTAWSTISHAVNGLHDPSLGLVAAIAAALEVAPQYLLGLSDKPEAPSSQFPVPEPELWQLVTEMNTLQSSLRDRLARSFLEIVLCVRSTPILLNDQDARFLEQFQELSEGAQEMVVSYMKHLLARSSAEQPEAAEPADVGEATAMPTAR